MLKGFRTYITIGLMVLVAVLPALKIIEVSPELLALSEAILGALTVYFRSQA